MKFLLLLTLVFMVNSGFAQPKNDTIPGRRYLLTALNTSGVRSDVPARILLRIKVDENGNVTGNPVVLKERTTTDNQRVLDEVIAIVKRDARFNSGTVQTILLTINIRGDKETTTEEE